MKFRNNSHKRVLSGNLPNNFNQQNKKYSNLPNEEKKQIGYETELLNGVDSNLNNLLLNLKTNNTTKDKIYYPLNSKIKSPMKINTKNNSEEINLLNEYNLLIENNTHKSNDYISQNNSFHQNNLSDYSYPYSYTPGIINNKFNDSPHINSNNNPNMKVNLSYSGHRLNDRNQNFQNYNINTDKRISNKKNNYEMNNNIFERDRTSSFNRKKRLIRNKNNQNNRNNIQIIPNNLTNFNSTPDDQINQIMNQLKEMNIHNAQNKRDIYAFQKEYLKMQNQILSSIENLNINNNIKSNEFKPEKLQNMNINNLKDKENFELKNTIKNLEESNKKEKNSLITNLNNKDEELIRLKNENTNLISEIEQYKKKIEENENDLKSLSKENKDIKGKLLILEYQKKNISKEYKINKEKLDGLQDDNEQLIKQRNIYQKQKNILDNEIKIMKLNNNRINTIKINNNFNSTKNLRLKTEIENLTKEKNNLKEKNEILRKTIDDFNKKKNISENILNNFKRAKSAGRKDINNNNDKDKEIKKFNSLEKKYKSVIKYKNKLSEKINEKEKKIISLENSLNKKQKEINELKEKIKLVNTKPIIKQSEDKTKEIKKLEKKLSEKENEIKEKDINYKKVSIENKEKFKEIKNLKEKIKLLETQNLSLNNLIQSYSQKNNSNITESKKAIFISTSTVLNKPKNIINDNKMENFNFSINSIQYRKKEKENFNERVKFLNEQLESLQSDNNILKNDLDLKRKQNKELQKLLKEKEDRIKALENEIKLKEREEERKAKGKLKESQNELKRSEFGEIYYDEINDMGKSQNDLEKENELLKDEIMKLKKDLDLIKYNQSENMVTKEEYDKIISENSSLKRELFEEKDKNSKNNEEKQNLKQGIISSLNNSDKTK